MSLAGAHQGAGIAQGFQQGTSPEREASRAAARVKKEEGDQQLARLKATKLTEKDTANLADIQSLEIKNLKAQQQQTLRLNNERATYSAFERYDAGKGDVRHINTMLGDLAGNGSNMFSDVARVDKLTEEDRQLMDNQGLQNADAIISDPSINQSYVKTTLKDGTVEVRSMDELKGSTKYNRYANEQELARQKAEKEVSIMASLGYSDLSEISREAFRRAAKEVGDPKAAGFDDAYTKHYDDLRNKGYSSRSGSKSDGLTQAEAYAKRDLADRGILPGSPEYNSEFNAAMDGYNTKFSRTSTTRNLEQADEVRTQLDDLDILGGNAPLDLRSRAKIEPLINKLEQFAGVEMSTADKATLERINELTRLGGEAGKLTDNQTGLIDRVVRQVSKYVSDNTEGAQQARPAYAGYRNVVRNALFGSVLTPGETKSFVEQFGSLGQQRGPVLAQLRSSLEQVKSNYETLVQTNDPYVMAYRTGKTANELQDVLDALDERINMVDDAMSGKVIRKTTTPPAQSTTKEQADNTVLTPEKRTGLDAIRRSVDS